MKVGNEYIKQKSKHLIEIIIILLKKLSLA